ncbi:mitotic deacetylase associated SANT domain protein a isoform X2 [Lampris incognitus]|uniref:mitotic deacetylase associated SANT domain protein a isoform X2 n=1 Tax=Lampris incognitus TaxID=2546036 RepID=UPI0024B53639|nr:mitotic deacetylase associated SANT domain protein a isoform X2 [Lampris incognitus]
MSLPPQHKVSSDKSSKHSAAAMKEPLQHPGEVYYGMGPPVVEPGHSDSGSTSGVYNQEKGPQSRLQYQQAAPVKWMHQEPIQPSGWSQEVSVPGWGQNFVPYMGGPNIRGQMAFHKGGQNVGALQMGGENQQTGSVEAYRESPQAQTQAQARGLEWEQHAATAAMHQAQLQAYQQGHKGVDIQGQPHAPPQAMPGSVLQPFQATFKTAKQQFPSGYYPVFQGHKAIPSLGYSEQPKTQQQLLHQMQQQQMHHHQQQQLRQQHHHQLQQQHLQQQQHQMQQRQIHQQQQLQQMQQQYHQHQLQERRQQIHQMQQQLQPQPNVSQPEVSQLQVHQKQLHTQNFMAYEPAEPCPSDPSVSNLGQQQEAEIQADDPPASSIPCSEKVSSDPMQSENAAVVVPRRSRRLSREGLSPVAPPPTIPCSQASKETPPSQNGVAEAEAVRTGEAQVTTGGVIHSTRRRRRASKEINLETLAQKASEMESLPAKVVKEDGPQGRQAGMVPLVIPVSVPVCGSQTDPLRAWPQEQGGPSEEQPNQPNHKPSVIVARRRSLRSSMSESFGQDGETCPGQDEEGKSKSKRRPRPEPLFIPPPKPSTFIAPSVYSSITSYQSHLRSPVRLPDNPLTLPPYTPPPILSPVREGSGLYFSTFLSNIAASNQSLPPPATPKSASRSLLRSSSSDITPPVLPLITDATPVSLEPRINIGQQYQAEVPELRECCAAQVDQHKADLVWLPMDESQLKHGDQDRTKDMMNLACSSVFRGGGTNQELVLHCLHQYGGNILETLNCLMLEDTIIPKDHHLTDYHYSGSDRWTAAEKCYFNKGISAYRKDFFRVQKLVRTKTVAQCVEFYYTYKKQVKIGRNGTLTYGPPDSFMDKGSEAVVDIKSSQRSKMNQGEGERGDKLEQDLFDQGQDESLARVAQSLQAHDYAATVLVLQEKDVGNRQIYTQSILPPGSGKPVPEPAGKKSRAPPKASQDPEGVFPCKKCSRVFYKVKSRSAHMKSHAEQEKKAAAQRQREEEEEVRKAAAAEAQVKKAAVAAAMAAGAQAGNGSGGTEQAEVSSQGESSEGEDEDDDDWQ